MKRRRGRHFLKFLLFAVLALAVFSGALMLLWNRLVPPIFGWHAIGYGQAVGLLVLSRLLFGRAGFGAPWRGMQWRRRMWERWNQMTPEERERFREAMRERCGGRFEPKPTPTQAG